MTRAKKSVPTHPLLEPAQLLLTANLDPKIKQDFLQNPDQLRVDLQGHWHQLQMTLRASTGEDQADILKRLGDLLMATAKVALYYELNSNFKWEEPVKVE